jgi:hypothetical protein
MTDYQFLMNPTLWTMLTFLVIMEASYNGVILNNKLLLKCIH